ncbi:hypothetical protein M407DRAFT_17909 [Tulasnella calospora MUT 4182]|uniref:DRBM domain-containing protein n=1 Tax=Tulasnella calospora MUT 4182 TaxID=1051891 RepID=A0A0C3QWR1_9AGAM|nr:hypothetical protein M407DRAFT_17909 [Tulasnella calospora MUT 4182]
MSCEHRKPYAEAAPLQLYFLSSPADPDHQYRMHINDWVQKRRLRVIIGEPIAYGPSHNQTWVARIKVTDCWQCQDLVGQTYVAEGKTKAAANDTACKLLLQDCTARGLSKNS